MQVVVDNLLVKYDKSSKGPVVLLLHGWGDSKETFRKLLHELGSDYTYVALDLPGFGGSESPKETYNLEKYSFFVSDFLKKIQLNSVFAVIGHSNGGAIAIKGVSSNIFSCDKLVLIASSGVRQPHNPKSRLIRLVAKTAKVPVSVFPKKTQLKIKKRVYKMLGSDLFVAENMQDTFKEVVSEDLRTKSRNIRIPTLLLYGSRDRATPVLYGSAFHKNIKKSELRIIDGAEHFLHHTNTDEVSRLVKDFLVDK